MILIELQPFSIIYQLNGLEKATTQVVQVILIIEYVIRHHGQVEVISKLG
jgi:hypothetical protein